MSFTKRCWVMELSISSAGKTINIPPPFTILPFSPSVSRRLVINWLHHIYPPAQPANHNGPYHTSKPALLSPVPRINSELQRPPPLHPPPAFTSSRAELIMTAHHIQISCFSSSNTFTPFSHMMMSRTPISHLVSCKPIIVYPFMEMKRLLTELRAHHCF